MFERFTDRARRVVVLAQEEARRLHHGWIGTEHLLLGLLSESEGIGAQALLSQGTSLVDLRQEVETIIGRGSSDPPSHIPFTPRAKKIFELSLREAIGLGHDYIGTEHFLLGLLREKEGVAYQVLERAGLDPHRLRVEVVGLSGSQPPESKSSPPENLRSLTCVHPSDELEVLPAEGFRTVRCRQCGALVGVLPAA